MLKRLPLTQGCTSNFALLRLSRDSSEMLLKEVLGMAKFQGRRGDLREKVS